MVIYLLFAQAPSSHLLKPTSDNRSVGTRQRVASNLCSSQCASDDQQINYRFLFIDETDFQRHGQNLTRCYYYQKNFLSFSSLIWFGNQKIIKFCLKIQKEKRTTLKRSFLSLYLIHKNAVELFHRFLHFVFSQIRISSKHFLWFLLLLFTPIRAIHGKSKVSSAGDSSSSETDLYFQFHGLCGRRDVTLLLPMTSRDHQESLPVLIDAVSVAVCTA